MRTSKRPRSSKSAAHTCPMQFRRSVLALAVGHALCLPAVGAHAATITVTSSTDNGFGCTLREALANANNDNTGDGNDCVAGSGVDTINFDLSQMDSSTITLGGSKLTVSSDIVIDGDTDNDGIPDVELNANKASRVMHIEGANVTLEGLVLTGGYISTFNTTTYGPGISVGEYSSLLLANSVVTGNEAVSAFSGGGGVHVEPNSSATIQDSMLSGNSVNASGGAVLFNGNDLTVTDTTVSNNHVENSYGGGLALKHNGTAVISNSIISGNSAQSGGGIDVAGDPESTLEILDSTIADNTAIGGLGGGADISSGFTISGSTISGNQANADLGGGGLNLASVGGGNTIVNSTISGNSGGYAGGGLLISSTNVTIYNSTIFGNSAPVEGSGIYAKISSAVTLINSIVADETGGINDCWKDAYTTVGAGVDSIIEDDGCGTSAYNLFPALGPLADNGGPTLTHLPDEGSPTIDGGTNTDCGTGTLVEVDQRGKPRAADGDENGTTICDIGAVEVQPLIDSDSDGIVDPLDRLPDTPSNDCVSMGLDVTYDFQVVGDGEIRTCATRGSVTLTVSTTVESGGTLEVITPNTDFDPGFALPVGAQLQVIAADPDP